MSSQDKKAWVVVAVLFYLFITLTGAVSRPGQYNAIAYEKLSVTSNISGESMSDELIGGCLYAVEVKCMDDDAITVTLNSDFGTELYTLTTTGASAGEADIVDNFFPINHPMTYTISGYGDSSGCTVEVTSWQK